MKLNETGSRLLERGCALMDEASRLAIEEYGENAEVGWDDIEEYDLDKTDEDFAAVLLYAYGTNALSEAFSWVYSDPTDWVYYGSDGRHIEYGRLLELLLKCYAPDYSK